MSNEYKSKYLRQLPSIEKLISQLEPSNKIPLSLITKSLREIIDSRRSLILSAENEDQLQNINLSAKQIIIEAQDLAIKRFRMDNRYAINATGDVFIRYSPLNESAQKAINNIVKGYSVSDDMNGLLTSITGAESSLVVNNGNSALMLALYSICNGKDVIVSRGELVNDESRLPELIELSGARLVPVGTTNKTHPKDYKDAINENTGAILKVRMSNCHIVGFTEQVALTDLAKENLPVIDYIINGCLVDLTQFGFPEEPYVSMSIKNGADIVCFNGDRFLGGPQSGIIAGKDDYISLMRESPLYNILKPNKLTLSALEGTLKSYLDTDKILDNNIVLKFISRTYDEIAIMVQNLSDKLGNNLNDSAIISFDYGYTYFNSIYISRKLPTRLIVIKPLKISSDELARRLLMRDIPVIVISREDHIILDLRAVWLDELGEIAIALIESCH